MKTIKEELQKQLGYHEGHVAQLRGKLTRLQQRCPGVLDIKAPLIHVTVSTHGVSITLYDKEHELPALPTLLLSLAETQKVDKKRYGEGDEDEMEYFSFRIAGVNVDLDRRMLKTRKCRRAIVQQETSFCGSVPFGMEVIEWLDDE